MTSKIHNFNQSSSYLSHYGKMEKPSPRLSKGILDGSFLSQRESKGSYCQWLVNGIKKVFEKFLAFLRCLFCCKCPEKKKEAVTRHTESKTDHEPASTSLVKEEKPETNPNATLATQSKQNPIPEPTSTTTEKTGLKKDLEASTKAQEKLDEPQSVQVAPKAEEKKDKKVEKTTIAVEDSLHNETFGDFARVHKDVKGLIGEYLAHPDTLNLAQTYPDLAEKMYRDLVKKIEMKETINALELPVLFERLIQLAEIFSGPIDMDSPEMVLKFCKNLKKISFNYTNSWNFLHSACSYLPSSVTTIDLAKNRAVTDSLLEIIARTCPQLREINLWDCKQITDEGIKALAANCKDLKKLVLSFCEQVTDEGLKALAVNCKELQELNLVHCNIRDEGIEALSANCPKLQQLRINSSLISDAALQSLSSCKQLKKLTLAYDYNIHHRLNTIRAFFPPEVEIEVFR